MPAPAWRCGTVRASECWPGDVRGNDPAFGATSPVGSVALEARKRTGGDRQPIADPGGDRATREAFPGQIDRPAAFDGRPGDQGVGSGGRAGEGRRGGAIRPQPDPDRTNSTSTRHGRRPALQTQRFSRDRTLLIGRIVVDHGFNLADDLVRICQAEDFLPQSGMHVADEQDRGMVFSDLDVLAELAEQGIDVRLLAGQEVPAGACLVRWA